MKSPTFVKKNTNIVTFLCCSCIFHHGLETTVELRYRAFFDEYCSLQMESADSKVPADEQCGGQRRNQDFRHHPRHPFARAMMIRYEFARPIQVRSETGARPARCDDAFGRTLRVSVPTRRSTTIVTVTIRYACSTVPNRFDTFYPVDRIMVIGAEKWRRPVYIARPVNQSAIEERGPAPPQWTVSFFFSFFLRRRANNLTNPISRYVGLVSETIRNPFTGDPAIRRPDNAANYIS